MLKHLKNRHTWVLLCLPLIVLVWFLPHTNSVRYGGLTALALLCLTAPDIRQRVKAILGSAPLWVLWALTLWLLIQLGLFAWFPAETWHELRGQWFKKIAFFVAGVSLASLATTAPSAPPLRHPFAALTALFYGLTLMMTIQVVEYGYWLLNGISPLMRVGLFGQKNELSYIANILFALGVAEGVARHFGAKSVLNLSAKTLAFACLMAASVALLSGARNGVIGMILVFGSSAVLTVFLRRHSSVSSWRWLLVGGALSVGLAVASWQLDPRWARFAETLPHALHSADHPSWLDEARYRFPLLKDGKPAEISAYERVAFMTEGLKFSATHPAGIGFTRKAFSHAMEATFGQPSRHAHSGVVEWLIGMGWLGMALWMVFLGLLFRQGFGHFLRYRSALGLLLAFVVAGFFGRMFIEIVTRDLAFELFMLVLGILVASVRQAREQAVLADPSFAGR